MVYLVYWYRVTEYSGYSALAPGYWYMHMYSNFPFVLPFSVYTFRRGLTGPQQQMHD
jgi:hypothetical protein